MTIDLLSGLWVRAAAPALEPRDWEALLSQARRARLLGRVAQHFQQRGWLADVPDAPRRHLDNALRQVRRQRDEARWEADCLRRALGHLGTPVVLLKGAAYVLADLPPARGRLFTDIDILVPKARLRDVEIALFGEGWVAAAIDPYDERYYRDWMHELPPLQHIQRRTALDVHHSITPPTSRFAVDARRLLERLRPLASQPGLSVLAPEDMVLHGVVHLMQDGDFSGGLRDLLDFADLVQTFAEDPAFWPALVERADELGLGRPLHHALAQASRLFGLAPPATVAAALDRLAPAWPARTAMRALLEQALRPDHPDCDGALTGTARWLLYVRSHWLRMPWYQILPHLMRKGWRRFTALREKRNPQQAQAGLRV